MRSPRLVVAAIAVALTASMTSVAPSATARIDPRPAPAAAAAPTVERAAAITITSRVVKRRMAPDRPKRLVFQGTVTPAKGPVYIQRATRCNRAVTACNFTFYRKVFLKKGAYAAVIAAPPTQRGWVWRAKVKTSYSKWWVTCTKRPLQDCTVPR
ncbi:MAG: hypothetical protein JWN84_2153 [Nocardioides sp.]|nr:hypothetical protein [Nocardioides sp.]